MNDNAQVDRERFIRLVLALVASVYPRAVISDLGPDLTFSFVLSPGATLICRDLTGVYQAWVAESDPARKTQVAAEVLGWIDAYVNRPGTWDAAAERLIPVVYGAPVAPSQFRHRVPFPVEGLDVAVEVAIDGRDAFSCVEPSDFQRWGVTPSDVYRVAVENLCRGGFVYDTHGEGLMVTCPAPVGYQGSWMLCPDVLAYVAEITFGVGVPVIVTVPNRETLRMVPVDGRIPLEPVLVQAIDDWKHHPGRVSPLPYRITNESTLVKWDPVSDGVEGAVPVLVELAEKLQKVLAYQVQRETLTDSLTRTGEVGVVVAGCFLECDDNGDAYLATDVTDSEDTLVPEVEYVRVHPAAGGSFVVHLSDLELLGLVEPVTISGGPKLWRVAGATVRAAELQLRSVATTTRPFNSPGQADG